MVFCMDLNADRVSVLVLAMDDPNENAPQHLKLRVNIKVLSISTIYRMTEKTARTY